MNKLTKKARTALYGAAATGLMLATFVPAAMAGSLGDSVTGNFKSTGEGVYGGSVPQQELPELVGSIINAALGLLGVILVVLFIYAGFLWMTAAGNEEKVKKARGMMTNAVIGMIIIFAAYAITQFVIDAIINATA